MGTSLVKYDAGGHRHQDLGVVGLTAPRSIYYSGDYSLPSFLCKIVITEILFV